MAALHHIALGAVDVQLVAEFYRVHLGLAELRRHHHNDGTIRSIWLDLGTAVLMVEHTLEKIARDRPIVDGVNGGVFLLAFEVTEAEKTSSEQRLSDAGLKVEGRTDYSTYYRDPEGNRFALSSAPLRDL